MSLKDQKFTGFNLALDSQTELTLFGIKLQIGFLLGLFLVIGGLLFWKFYDFSPVKLKKGQSYN